MFSVVNERREITEEVFTGSLVKFREYHALPKDHRSLNRNGPVDEGD